MTVHDLSGLRVLVVDDNRHFLTIIRTMLRAYGIREIFECTDAVQGLEVMKSTDIDFALVDMKLEDLDGLEFTQLVRSAPDSNNPRMPIIMVTAYSERSRVENAISSGVDEFLVKPISPQKLYDRIIAVIESPRKYISCPSYHGPDRRRLTNQAYKGTERREEEKLKAASALADEMDFD
ncbi:MAG: response regulator [Alphaproteobacteria bacterium]